MKIKDIFEKPIDRRIEEVIKVTQIEESVVRDEITEYVVTDTIKDHFIDVLKAYSEAPTSPHEGIGIWVSGKAEYLFKRKDSQKIVIDEIAGILISLFMLPHGFWIVLSAFIIFRLIDISKPFYILEKLPSGFGVMMDDVAAGIATNLILRIFLRMTQ